MNGAILSTLAWRPLLDPVEAHGLWPWMLLPLVVLLPLLAYRRMKTPGASRLSPSTVNANLASAGYRRKEIS